MHCYDQTVLNPVPMCLVYIANLDLVIGRKSGGNKVTQVFVKVTWVHYNDVIMSAMTSQITGVSMVCSTVCSDADQRKQQSSASLAFVRGIHR